MILMAHHFFLHVVYFFFLLSPDVKQIWSPTDRLCLGSLTKTRNHLSTFFYFRTIRMFVGLPNDWRSWSDWQPGTNVNYPKRRSMPTTTCWKLSCLPLFWARSTWLPRKDRMRKQKVSTDAEDEEAQMAWCQCLPLVTGWFAIMVNLGLSLSKFPFVLESVISTCLM